MALTTRTILSLALAFLWQWWRGWARLGSLSGPAGDVGLCLALMLYRLGLPARYGLGVWALTLVSGSLLSGVAPVWSFLIGWPAWLAVQALGSQSDSSERLSGPAFLVYSSVLITISRCTGKLLMMSFSGVPVSLTISGTTLAGSLLAEAWPNILFLLLFRSLLGPRRDPR